MIVSSPLRVLYVEDNLADLSITEDALAKSPGLRITNTTRLAEAIAVLEAEPIDVVLLDLGLPDSQGLDTLRRVRRCNDDVTVVVLTGLDDEELSCQALREGAQDVLTKGRADFGALERMIRYAVERNTVEVAVKESEARFRTLVDSLPDAIVINAGGRVAYCNPACERLLGADDADQLLGMPSMNIMHPDFHEVIVRRIAVLQAGAKMVEPLEEKVVRLDGKCVPVCVTAVSIKDRGRDAILVILRDLSEEKAREELLRQALKMEAVGQLAGGVAHDFNNLLTVINGYGELLGKEIPPEGMAGQCLAEMVAAGERAASLTRQLLTFTRHQPVVPKAIGLNQVVANLRNMLLRLIREDIEVNMKLASELWEIKADPGQVEQVIVNLVVNARDAMPSGGTITIETSNVEVKGEYTPQRSGTRPGSYVRLVVRDEGHGMTELVKARIFEPYFTTKEAGKGTGMGLAIVFGVVNGAGGTVSVQSQVGVGTAFEILLPRAAEKPVEPAKASTKPVPVAAGSETVLLVEDDAAVRGLLNLYLERGGYNVLVASDGAQALQVAEDNGWRIDLLVTDVIMPVKGGREVADELTQKNRRTKVVFLSGYTGDVTGSRGVLPEQFNYIQKPCSQVELLRKVREILQQT